MGRLTVHLVFQRKFPRFPTTCIHIKSCSFCFGLIQVTTLVNQNGPSNKKKGRSKKANVLSAAVQKATEHFIIQGDQIAHDFPEVEHDMLAAIDEVRKTGKF